MASGKCFRVIYKNFPAGEKAFSEVQDGHLELWQNFRKKEIENEKF
jgi:hypothetical protein